MPMGESVLRHRALVILVAAGLVATLLASTGGAAAGSATLTKVGEYRHTYATYNSQGTIGYPLSSPAFGDVTGDGVLDIVVGGMDGRLVVLDQSGHEERVVLVDSGGMIDSSPALADLTGDGVLDVVTSTVRMVPGASIVAAYDFTAGGARRFFAANDSGLAPQAGFMGAPAVGDVTGDGSLDIVAAGLDHRLHAWSLDGHELPGFPVFTYDTMVSSPALGDADGDGVLDIVVGGDMDFGQPIAAGGYVWAVHGNGTLLPGYPLWLGAEVVWSSPALADLDGDGRLDAVVGAGQNFHNGDSNILHAFTIATRASLPGWPQTLDGATTASPAIADVTGDGRPEIVETTAGGWVDAYAIDGHRLWHTCGLFFSSCPIPAAYATVISSPVVADVDGDAFPEVLYVGERQLKVIDGATGAVEPSPTLRSLSQTQFTHPGTTSAAVANVAGHAVIAVNTAENNNGSVAPDAGDEQAVYVFRSPVSARSLPWPTFHMSLDRWGLAVRTSPTVFRNYVDGVYMALLGRHADAGGLSYWTARLAAGMARVTFTGVLSHSDEWTGHVVTSLYASVFGRPPDAGGLAYWRSLIQGGMRVSTVAALLFGSDEYYAAHGGTPTGFVNSLYTAILGRPADGGAAYWVGLLSHGTSRATVAGAFYLSYESCVRRVDALYLSLLGRASDAAGRDYWAKQLATMDDIVLAALLVASDEFFATHQ
jgi:hypothetical protein